MREEIGKEFEDLVFAMGWVVHNFNHLERALALCISVLVDPKDPNVGRVVTAGKAYSSLVELFSALSFYRLESVMNRKLENNLASLLKRLDEVNDMRNKVVHSRYLYGVQEKTFRRSKLSMKIRKGVKSENANVNPEVVYMLSKDIQKLTFDIRKFTEIEIVPVVLAPIWKNDHNDIGMIWGEWRHKYQELENKEGKVYIEFLNR